MTVLITLGYIVETKSDAAGALKKFLADVKAVGVPQVVRSDDGGEFSAGEFRQVCVDDHIKQEFTTAHTPQLNGAAERALGLIQSTALATRFQAEVLFPRKDLAATDRLWAEATHWACDALNRTSTSASKAYKRRYEMWHGVSAPLQVLPFLKPCFFWVYGHPKTEPTAEEKVSTLGRPSTTPGTH